MAAPANRSVPSDTLVYHQPYRDIERAIEWLCRVFGFTENFRVGEPIHTAQLQLGGAVVMARNGDPALDGPFVTVIVRDVDALYARAREAGATITEPLHEAVYGERQFAATDLEGNTWMFSEHATDRAPEEWGAHSA
jgi:uncharacterized glyoxalase superfamily protein PhnB